MGGSGSGHGGGNGGGGGVWVDRDQCGGEFTFFVNINNENMEEAWIKVSIGDKVSIQSLNDTIPIMNVLRDTDAFVIGAVPAGLSGLFGCIQNGWDYHGKIVEKMGNVDNPRIKVTVQGSR